MGRDAARVRVFKERNSLEPYLLNDLLIVIFLSILVLLASHRAGIPAVAGLLITGILAGPEGLALVEVVHEAEALTETGVLLLLFTIGIEFSLKGLIEIRKTILLGGSLQVLLTQLGTFFAARWLGASFGEAVFYGFLVSLSSTAVVFKLLQERGEVDSPHGQASVGMLIFQDIVVVPMMLFTPLLAGAYGNPGEQMLWLGAKAAGIIVVVLLSARWLIPGIMYHVAKTRIRELFLLTVFGLCFGIVWLTSVSGLSLALGAFLAGLIISESEYSSQALSNILPFKDVFSSLFFVSIGMLLDFSYVMKNPGIVITAATAVILFKTCTAGVATAILGFPLRTAVIAGIGLSQVGEFSFILSETGRENGLLTGDTYSLFLSVTVLSMLVTPLVMKAAPRLADLALRLPMPGRLRNGPTALKPEYSEKYQGHVLIIGFGATGRHVAHAAKASRIPYAILEMNPDTVRVNRARSEPIFYGDATQEPVLRQVHVETARVVVVAINDPAATRRITEVVRRLARQTYIVVRTRYLKEMDALYELGADVVIPEEFETSVEIFTRVLMHFLVPLGEIEKTVAEIRSHGYDIFRKRAPDTRGLSGLRQHFPGVDIAAIRTPERTIYEGRSLAELALRQKHGVSILAIRRGERVLSNPESSTVLESRDILIVIGPPEKIAETATVLGVEVSGPYTLLRKNPGTDTAAPV